MQLFIDTETYKEVYRPKWYDTSKMTQDEIDYNSKQKAYLLGACDESKNFMFWKSTADFLKYLITIPDETINIYIFNASYDLGIIINDAFHFGYTFYPQDLKYDEDKKFICGFMWLYYTTYKKENGIILKDKKGKAIVDTQIKKKINITDLWMFDRTMSIDDYTKLLYPNEKEKHKLKIDYVKSDVVWKGNTLWYTNDMGQRVSVSITDELNYLKNDILVMPDILKYIKEFKWEAFKALELSFDIPEKADKDLWIKEIEKNPLTIPSLMKQITSLFMMKEGIKMGYKLFRPEVEKEMYEIMENSYLGGYTFQNKTKGEWENVWKLDVNSEYPFQEYSRNMPIGLPTTSKPDGDYIEWIMVKIDDYVFNDKYSFLSVPLIPEYKYGKKMLLTREYFNLLVDKGKLINLEIYGTYYTMTTPIMKKIIGLLYSLKSEAQNKQIRRMAKLLLNSSYGKKAMKAKTETHSWNYLKEINGYRLELEIDDEPEYNSNLGGVYIAQCARLTLFQGIDACLEKGEVILGDTDSIFTTADPKTLNLKIDSKEIGAWDIESVFEKDGVKTPKPYDKLMYVNGIRKKYYAWYESDKDQVSLAFSGIPTDIVLSLPHKDRMTIFNPNNNVVFREAKKASKDNAYSQKQIYQTDFMSNNKLEITHQCVFNKEKQQWQLIENN